MFAFLVFDLPFLCVLPLPPNFRIENMFVVVTGYIALGVMAASCLRYLAKYFRSPLDVSSLGDWALVTGATDGIGEHVPLLDKLHSFYQLPPCLKIHTGLNACTTIKFMIPLNFFF